MFAVNQQVPNNVGTGNEQHQQTKNETRTGTIEIVYTPPGSSGTKNYSPPDDIETIHIDKNGNITTFNSKTNSNNSCGKSNYVAEATNIQQPTNHGALNPQNKNEKWRWGGTANISPLTNQGFGSVFPNANTSEGKCFRPFDERPSVFSNSNDEHGVAKPASFAPIFNQNLSSIPTFHQTTNCPTDAYSTTLKNIAEQMGDQTSSKIDEPSEKFIARVYLDIYSKLTVEDGSKIQISTPQLVHDVNVAGQTCDKTKSNSIFGSDTKPTTQIFHTPKPHCIFGCTTKACKKLHRHINHCELNSAKWIISNDLIWKNIHPNSQNLGCIFGCKNGICISGSTFCYPVDRVLRVMYENEKIFNSENICFSSPCV